MAFFVGMMLYDNSTGSLGKLRKNNQVVHFKRQTNVAHDTITPRYSFGSVPRAILTLVQFVTMDSIAGAKTTKSIPFISLYDGER